MSDLRTAALRALEAMDELHRTGDTQVFDLCHRETTEELRAALAEPQVIGTLPEFPPHDDKVHPGAVYWYVGTDGKYYSSNEVKLFMDAKTKSLFHEPPQWLLDKGGLIPLVAYRPNSAPIIKPEIKEDNSVPQAQQFLCNAWADEQIQKEKK